MFCFILIWLFLEKYLKHFYTFFYSILYGGSLITYDLSTSEEFSKTNIPNSPIFLIAFESGLIFLLLITIFRLHG